MVLHLKEMIAAREANVTSRKESLPHIQDHENRNRLAVAEKCISNGREEVAETCSNKAEGRGMVVRETCSGREEEGRDKIYETNTW
jgi:hypothetical protein